MRRCLLWLVFAVMFVPGIFAATQPARTDAQRKLVGHWRLVSFVNVGANGEQRPGQYDSGRILYDEHGNMSAHLMRSGRKPLSSPATETERATAYSGYLGYWGRYVVDEAKGSVTHHVEGSSNPNWVATQLVRFYEFSPDGNRLMLSLKSGDRVTGTLTWQRLSATP